MVVAALVMAGGKATRMQSNTEKPLIRINNKPMIQLVIEALRQTPSINRIVVAVGPGTQQTAHAVTALGVEVVNTAGNGYKPDMQEAIRSLGLGDVVVVSADLPFLSPKIVELAIEKYRSSKKPALMVAASEELFKRFDMEPSYVFMKDDCKLVPVGLNIVNGKRIDEPVLDEIVFVSENDDLVYNVNRQRDLEIARKHAAKASNGDRNA
jgi:adenosylcobinamide-phosphate guanylyltransferase